MHEQPITEVIIYYPSWGFLIMKKQDIPLIIGGDSQLGNALKNHFQKAGIPFIETTRRKQQVSSNRLFLDLSEDIEYWEPPENVSTAYICAAITSMETCNREPDRSGLINIFNTLKIAKKCIHNEIFVIFPSTNMVFGGSRAIQGPEGTVDPKTEYGRQKAETERLLLPYSNKVAIVRFTKIISSNMVLFNSWIQSLKNQEPIYPFSDMVMAPVPDFLAADVLHRISQKRYYGIFQLSGPRDVTYAQIAHHLADRLCTDHELVRPIKASDSNINIAVLLKHTTLDSSLLKELFGITVPEPMDVIDSIFKI